MATEMISVTLRAPRADMQHIVVDGWKHDVNKDLLITIPVQHVQMARALGFVTPEEHASSIKTARQRKLEEIEAMDVLEGITPVVKATPAPAADDGALARMQKQIDELTAKLESATAPPPAAKTGPAVK